MCDSLPRSDRRAPLAVIGVGNRLRGDDAVGIEVARALGDLADGDRVAVHTIEGDCLGLLDRWAGADTALVIDAARSIHAPGSIAELDAGSTPLPSGLSLRSSHAFGVADAVELARALGVLPPAVVIYAIEGRSFGYGDGLTRAVAAAAEEVTRRIRERVETSGAARRPRASFPATQRTRDARSTSRLE